MRQQHIEMFGKAIALDISKTAERQLQDRKTPLFVEMELYFSCLLRKEIRIRESMRASLDEEFLALYSDVLHVSFRPVMTKSCSVSACQGDKPSLSGFAIKKSQCYVPKWLRLEFKKGEWCGDFGY